MLLAGWLQAAFEDTFKGLYGRKIAGMFKEGREIIELKTFILKIIYKENMGKAPKIKEFSFHIENVVWKYLYYSLPHFHGLLEKFFSLLYEIYGRFLRHPYK